MIHSLYKQILTMVTILSLFATKTLAVPPTIQNPTLRTEVQKSLEDFMVAHDLLGTCDAADLKHTIKILASVGLATTLLPAMTKAKLGTVGLAVSVATLLIMAVTSEKRLYSMVSRFEDFKSSFLNGEALSQTLGVEDLSDGTMTAFYENDIDAFFDEFLQLNPEAAKFHLTSSPKLRTQLQELRAFIEKSALLRNFSRMEPSTHSDNTDVGLQRVLSCAQNFYR